MQTTNEHVLKRHEFVNCRVKRKFLILFEKMGRRTMCKYVLK
jgi:hypothetical protein